LTKITFLGTSGGRFATIHQTRATGGIFIEDSINISLDPGPGAIVRMNEIKIDPTKIDLLLVSHSHPDHYTDSDIIVEAITRGGTEKRGAIIGSKSVISGAPGFSPKVSNYHLSRLEKVFVVKPNDKVEYNQLKITATPTQHTDPFGIGFKFHLKDGIVTYTGDTSLNNKIIESYFGTRLLIMAMTTPMGFKLHHHLSPEEAVVVLKKVKPEMVILTHFGIKAIDVGTEKIAQWISENSNVNTIAAEDKMVVEIADEIKVHKP
jgi:ribonuclease BN (tRNA processing enzyme)